MSKLIRPMIAAVSVTCISLAYIGFSDDSSSQVGTEDYDDKFSTIAVAKSIDVQQRPLGESKGEGKLTASDDENGSYVLRKPQAGWIPFDKYQEVSAYGPVPKKVSGVELPKLLQDAQGNLVLTKELRQVFEHFLSGSDVEGLSVALSRIEEYLELTLDEQASAQALEVLDQYVSYKNNAGAEPQVMPIGNDPYTIVEQMEESLDTRKRIRREYLSDDAISVFYLDEEAYDEYTLNKAKINLDDSLSIQEKHQALYQAEEQLPEAMKLRVRGAREEKIVQSEIEAMKKEGASANEIYQKRADFFGEETAQRLANLEDDSSEWLSRVASYESEKMALTSSEGLSAQQKQQQLDELKTRHFTPSEQVKLAFQKIGRLAESVN